MKKSLAIFLMHHASRLPALVFFYAMAGIINHSYGQLKIDTEKLQKQIKAAVSAAEQQKNLKRNFTLEEIWRDNKFKEETVYGLNSMKDGVHYTSLESDSTGSFIVKYSYKTGKTMDTIIFIPKSPEGDLSADTGTTFRELGDGIESYQFSSDETKLLISTESEQIYRHSTKEIYYIYELKTKNFSKISDEKIRLAEFSPDGNFIAYVKDNNLFIQDISSTAPIPKHDGGSFPVSMPGLQFTLDGKWNEIINGSTDWVYEEEFSFDKAFFWSPDGKKIAYYRFDESKVKEFSMDMFGTLYPTQYRYKYPKTGEENAEVSIHIYNLDARQSMKIDISDYEYIPRIKWTKDVNVLSIQKMNRHQSNLELFLADATTGISKKILSETSDTYLDITDDLTFLEDKKHFIRTSEKSGFNHIYLYNVNGNFVRQITNGNWDVTEFKGIDEKTQTLFYVSSEDSPIVRKLYSIKSDGTGKKKLSDKNGFNDAAFSKQFQYYINYFSDSYNPYHITLNDAAGKEIRVLKDNQMLKDTMALYNVSIKEFFKFTVKLSESYNSGSKLSEGYTLNGWMIKPYNFDSAKKYPVFMFVYGGPGSQTVQNNWGGSNNLWYQYLAQKGYIVVSVDNRGTGARGTDFKKCTYKELGKLETIDQVEAAKYLGSLPYVDKNRIGIQGWSYGGYLSTLCITKGNSLPFGEGQGGAFKMAIAVAPVTNWRFYDSIYTERFMQTPQENPKGYDDNSPINHVEKLKGKYLLIHGTADDNVHFQNSVEMVNALIKADKQFDLFFYPDKNHGIYGGNARLHLYTMMTDYIIENL